MNEQILELFKFNNIYAIVTIATQLINTGNTFKNMRQGD